MHRRGIKPFHQQPAFVVRRRVHWTENPAALPLGRPIECRLEKLAACLRVVLAFVKPEKGCRRLGYLLVMTVNDPGDAADILPVAAGHPELHFGVLKKWVCVGEHLFQIHQQRRDPVRVAVVNAVGQPQKAADISGALGQGDNFNRITHDFLS